MDILRFAVLVKELDGRYQTVQYTEHLAVALDRAMLAADEGIEAKVIDTELNDEVLWPRKSEL